LERSVLHDGAALSELAEQLVSLAGSAPERMAVAIEAPRGAVVELLVERGFHVFAINPKQLDRFRDRHTVAGAKDDRRDSFVLADSLRSDLHLFHRVHLDHPLIIQLRELSRVDDDLGCDIRRGTNRLRDQLNRFFPQILQLSAAADKPWVWSLLELAPSPAQAAALRLVVVKRLLREHRIRRISADEVVAILRRAPLVVAPGVTEAASHHIALLVPQLRLLLQQRHRCERRIELLLEQLGSVEAEPGQKVEHRDVQVLRSLPGVGRIVAATMLGEASQPLARRDYHALRAQAGVAPVTFQSGKRRTVGMRRACNQRLRQAVYHWARVSLQHDGRSKAHYAALRGRGLSHGRCIRGVADRLLAMLVSMLTNGQLYDPSRRLPVGAEG
jgi:transposase